MTPTRPILRYHGQKWRIAPFVLAHMPKHRVYNEPFGGGGAILLRKPRVAAEFYNDLDGRVVNVFRVLQDPLAAAELQRLIYLTPYARAEFEKCYQEPANSVDAARLTIALSQMGFGTDSIGRSSRTGFKSKVSGSGIAPAYSWATWPSEVPAFVERLRGVVIEQRDALEVIARVDSPDTLHYVDPPYVTTTRSSLADGRKASHGYRHEMNDEGHEALAALLTSVRGMVMISGYRSNLYDRLFQGWLRFDTAALADGAKRRTECLWLNERAACQGNVQGRLISNVDHYEERAA